MEWARVTLAKLYNQQGKILRTILGKKYSIVLCMIFNLSFTIVKSSQNTISNNCNALSNKGFLAVLRFLPHTAGEVSLAILLYVHEYNKLHRVRTTFERFSPLRRKETIFSRVWFFSLAYYKLQRGIMQFLFGERGAISQSDARICQTTVNKLPHFYVAFVHTTNFRYVTIFTLPHKS